MDNQEIVSRFYYYPPRSNQRVDAHREVRDHLGGLAQHFAGLLPDGREKSLAITKLEEAMFWANAALARASDPNATASEEEAAAGPRDKEAEARAEAEASPIDPLGDRPETPSVNLMPDEEEEPPECSARSFGLRCNLPAFGYIVIDGGKRRPMCEYHWREDDSGNPKERIFSNKGKG